MAIPIRHTVTCLRTEIVIRKFHIIAAFPCGAHEGTGCGYGRDAAIIGGIEHEVIKLIAAELKEAVQGIAGFASQLINDQRGADSHRGAVLERTGDIHLVRIVERHQTG